MKEIVSPNLRRVETRENSPLSLFECCFERLVLLERFFLEMRGLAQVYGVRERIEFKVLGLGGYQLFRICCQVAQWST